MSEQTRAMSHNCTINMYCPACQADETLDSFDNLATWTCACGTTWRVTIIAANAEDDNVIVLPSREAEALRSLVLPVTRGGERPESSRWFDALGLLQAFMEQTS